MLPPPNALGLPEKYTRWRKYQDDAIISLSASEKRFVGLVVPTGGGKSLTYMTHAEMSGAARVVVLTSTKSLQDQLGRDFEVVDIRGKANYDCVHEEAETGTKVSEAACQGGSFICPYRDKWERREKENGEEYWHLREGSGCPYYDRLKQARVASRVVTNYSYWLSIGSTGKGLGPFDVLVLDEAHAAPDELAGFLSVVVTKGESLSCLGRGLPREDEGSWWEWIEWAWVELNHQVTLYSGRHLKREERARLRRVGKLLAGVAQIRTIGAKQWVVEKKGAGTKWESMSWDIVNPAPYAEKFLFQGVGKVVLSSATVREKTLGLLGVKKGDSEMLEYPSTFPVERRPVIVVAGVPRMNFRVTEGQKELWLEYIDEIIDGRLDRRGIIHAVSFQRAKEIVGQSRHRKIMVLHDKPGSEGLKIAIEEYLGKSPSILVSPSATTGIDLPYTECEYQIIGKVPFPDMRAKVLKARMKIDPEYPAYIAAQVLVQASGRGMRAEDDLCETFIVDGNWGWFIGKYAAFTPRWWRSAVKRMEGVPGPLPKLTTRHLS